MSCQRIRKSETLFTHTKSVPRKRHPRVASQRKACSPATARWRDRRPRPAATTDRVGTNARGKFQRIVHTTNESIVTVAIGRDRSHTRRARGSVSRRHPIDRDRFGIVSPPRVGRERERERTIQRCEKIFYEIRTWTLVALKAATRPTKEEARRADISTVVCLNDDRARARG